MPRPSDIVDYLPARVAGVARRDLEQRLKRLRAARLYPPARAVGDRKAEPVNDQYMVNLFLALVGSAEAKYCAEAVQRLYDLSQKHRGPVKNMEVKLRQVLDREITLGNFLVSDIRRARRGELPRVKEIHVVDGKAEAMVAIRTTAETPGELLSEFVVFGGFGGAQTTREIHIRLSDGVLGALADFLGPIEDAA